MASLTDLERELLEALKEMAALARMAGWGLDRADTVIARAEAKAKEPQVECKCGCPYPVESNHPFTEPHPNGIEDCCGAVVAYTPNGYKRYCGHDRACHATPTEDKSNG